MFVLGDASYHLGLEGRRYEMFRQHNQEPKRGTNIDETGN
jgi:hypothetical protein